MRVGGLFAVECNKKREYREKTLPIEDERAKLNAIESNWGHSGVLVVVLCANDLPRKKVEQTIGHNCVGGFATSRQSMPDLKKEKIIKMTSKSWTHWNSSATHEIEEIRRKRRVKARK